jgi:hypothetical protein
MLNGALQRLDTSRDATTPAIEVVSRHSRHVGARTVYMHFTYSHSASMHGHK